MNILKKSKPIKKRLTLIVAILLLFAISLAWYFLYVPNPLSISTIWTTVTIITVSAIIGVVILEKKNSAHSFAWIIVLIFIPIAGILLYLTLGRNFRKRKIFTKKEIVDKTEIQAIHNFLNLEYKDKKELFPTALSSKVAQLLYQNSKAFLSKNNSVDIFADGLELFPKMLEDMDRAKHHIHVEYFALLNDETGREFSNMLIKKAKEGVQVRVILDDVGSWKSRIGIGKALKRAGVECFFFNKVRIPFLNSKFNYRNHRKIVVIDGEIGYLGGLNIGDQYASKDRYFGYWRDTHMRIVGGSVYSLQTVFLTDLYFTSGQYIFNHVYYPEVEVDNRLVMQLVTSGPDSDWASIMQVYFSSITNAQKSIYITSPYLILNDALIMALTTAALSQIDVRIILPGKPDHLVVFWGSRSYYRELLEAGVKIYEYQKGFIHAKVLSVDKEFCSIGTANMDIRSFNQNFEVNGILYDRDITAKIDRQFFEDIHNSKEILLEEVIQQSILTNFKVSIARLFSPIL